jgi:hypothetical protein
MPRNIGAGIRNQPAGQELKLDVSGHNERALRIFRRPEISSPAMPGDRLPGDLKSRSPLFYRRKVEGGRMGGMTDEVRGRSKIGTYLKYVKLTEGFGETFQDRDPDPRYKKVCKREMVQDPDTGEWVLHFHLHT